MLCTYVLSVSLLPLTLPLTSVSPLSAASSSPLDLEATTGALPHTLAASSEWQGAVCKPLCRAPTASPLMAGWTPSLGWCPWACPSCFFLSLCPYAVLQFYVSTFPVFLVSSHAAQLCCFPFSLRKFVHTSIEHSLFKFSGGDNNIKNKPDLWGTTKRNQRLRTLPPEPKPHVAAPNHL